MDRDRVIAEIVKRHGILVDRDDPVLMVSTMLELHEADHAEAVAEMRRIVDQGQAHADATIAEAKKLTAAAEKAATRPLLSQHQLHHDLLPKLLADTKVKTVAKMAGVWVAIGVVCAGLGAGVVWWFSTPLTCGATMITQAGARHICYRDDGPAPTPETAPLSATQPPATAPQSIKPAPQKKGT